MVLAQKHSEAIKAYTNSFEYEMLLKMRVRAENDKRNDAAKRIQRFVKTKRANKIFKMIVS